jgi:hypothetical protein
MSIELESPGLHRVESATVVAECCEMDVRRHRLVDSCKDNDVDELLVPTNLPYGNILIDGLRREGNDGGPEAVQPAARVVT